MFRLTFTLLKKISLWVLTTFSCTNLYTFSRFWDVWPKFWPYMNMVCSCAIWTVKLFGVDLQYNIYCNTLVNGDQTGEQTSALNLHFIHDDKRTHEYTLKLDKFLLFQHYVGHIVVCEVFLTSLKRSVKMRLPFKYEIAETPLEFLIFIAVGQSRK